RRSRWDARTTDHRFAAAALRPARSLARCFRIDDSFPSVSISRRRGRKIAGDDLVKAITQTEGIGSIGVRQDDHRHVVIQVAEQTGMEPRNAAVMPEHAVLLLVVVNEPAEAVVIPFERVIP